MAKSKQRGDTRKNGTTGGRRKGSAGGRIIAALQQAIDAERAGEHPSVRFTVREVELPDDPGEYTAAQVRRVRDLLNVSQAIFARLIGASEGLVKAWEQGGRAPSRMARRLLDDMRGQPDRWRQMVRLTGEGRGAA